MTNKHHRNNGFSESKRREKFFEKVAIIPFHGCWEWTGETSDKGYGRVYVGGKKYVQAHRYSLGLHTQLIPGLVIDHVCRNRACVNPRHLRQVTAKTNATENSVSIPALNKRKSRCLSGHPYNEANTIIRKNGNRSCRECKLISNRQYKNRNKSKVLAYEKERYNKNRKRVSAYYKEKYARTKNSSSTKTKAFL